MRYTSPNFGQAEADLETREGVDPEEFDELPDDVVDSTDYSSINWFVDSALSESIMLLLLFLLVLFVYHLASLTRYLNNSFVCSLRYLSLPLAPHSLLLFLAVSSCFICADTDLFFSERSVYRSTVSLVLPRPAVLLSVLGPLSLKCLQFCTQSLTPVVPNYADR